MENEMHGKLTGAGGEGGCVLGFYVPQADGKKPERIAKVK